MTSKVSKSQNEGWEEAHLSKFAVRAAQSLGRACPEEPCSLRTCFQRDRDRIVHSKSFRRLKHKTQVFIAPEGDHFRTRLTHTLEVSGISRTAARALGLNEDLAEAVSLGHDLGHTPFGHMGEEALSDALFRRTGHLFEHHRQSLRVVKELEGGGRGLNLCREVEDGILNHTGETMPASLEGRIVRLADRIAYINHDIDDALRAGIIGAGDLPRDEIALLGESCSRRIDALVHDLVDTSRGRDGIFQSPGMKSAMNSLRNFLFERVYLGSVASREMRRVRMVVDNLFDYYMEHPELLPEWTGAGQNSQAVKVTDYIAGMTDQFAIRTFKNVFLPQGWEGNYE
ncbi:MAG: deoxyguanosinetriphosphate triphosphohydrolase [Actinomycetota bacterium]|nr:deoxyguanosinetriphosphate triphosphohydrolase [Acidobacteriota bacterium]MCL6094030.1 deoxyguanosinetriphosphate triphosphohydrolase [Actinomycetota bacterium]MDA8166545.1 deoxyguanosinetriphosphate triphosphohydrolase [Actinomycetota bacterium]